MSVRIPVLVTRLRVEKRLEHQSLDTASNDAYLLVRRRDMPAAIVEARHAIGPQTFANERDRARLSAVALKAFLALMNPQAHSTA